MSPLAVVGGEETSLFLRGRNLNIPGTKYVNCVLFVSRVVPFSLLISFGVLSMIMVQDSLDAHGRLLVRGSSRISQSGNCI